MSDRKELAQRRRDRALVADGTLRRLFAAATGDETGYGLVLVAVGGYGRSELSPFSDLDVVLLHEPGMDEEKVLRG